MRIFHESLVKIEKSKIQLKRNICGVRVRSIQDDTNGILITQLKGKFSLVPFTFAFCLFCW